MDVKKNLVPPSIPLYRGSAANIPSDIWAGRIKAAVPPLAWYLARLAGWALLVALSVQYVGGWYVGAERLRIENADLKRQVALYQEHQRRSRLGMTEVVLAKVPPRDLSYEIIMRPQ